jgi:hypothetical protein
MDNLKYTIRYARTRMPYSKSDARLWLAWKLVRRKVPE